MTYFASGTGEHVNTVKLPMSSIQGSSVGILSNSAVTSNSFSHDAPIGYNFADSSDPSKTICLSVASGAALSPLSAVYDGSSNVIFKNASASVHYKLQITGEDEIYAYNASAGGYSVPVSKLSSGNVEVNTYYSPQWTLSDNASTPIELNGKQFYLKLNNPYEYFSDEAVVEYIPGTGSDEGRLDIKLTFNSTLSNNYAHVSFYSLVSDSPAYYFTNISEDGMVNVRLPLSAIGEDSSVEITATRSSAFDLGEKTYLNITDSSEHSDCVLFGIRSDSLLGTGSIAFGHSDNNLSMVCLNSLYKLNLYTSASGGEAFKTYACESGGFTVPYTDLSGHDNVYLCVTQTEWVIEPGLSEPIKINGSNIEISNNSDSLTSIKIEKSNGKVIFSAAMPDDYNALFINFVKKDSSSDTYKYGRSWVGYTTDYACSYEISESEISISGSEVAEILIDSPEYYAPLSMYRDSYTYMGGKNTHFVYGAGTSDPYEYVEYVIDDSDNSLSVNLSSFDGEYERATVTVDSVETWPASCGDCICNYDPALTSGLGSNKTISIRPVSSSWEIASGGSAVSVPKGTNGSVAMSFTNSYTELVTGPITMTLDEDNDYVFNIPATGNLQSDKFAKLTFTNVNGAYKTFYYTNIENHEMVVEIPLDQLADGCTSISISASKESYATVNNSDSVHIIYVDPTTHYNINRKFDVKAGSSLASLRLYRTGWDKFTVVKDGESEHPVGCKLWTYNDDSTTPVDSGYFDDASDHNYFTLLTSDIADDGVDAVHLYVTERTKWRLTAGTTSPEIPINGVNGTFSVDVQYYPDFNDYIYMEKVAGNKVELTYTTAASISGSQSLRISIDGYGKTWLNPAAGTYKVQIAEADISDRILKVNIGGYGSMSSTCPCEVIRGSYTHTFVSAKNSSDDISEVMDFRLNDSDELMIMYNSAASNYHFVKAVLGSNTYYSTEKLNNSYGDSSYLPDELMTALDAATSDQTVTFYYSTAASIASSSAYHLNGNIDISNTTASAIDVAVTSDSKYKVIASNGDATCYSITASKSGNTYGHSWLNQSVNSSCEYVLPDTLVSGSGTISIASPACADGWAEVDQNRTASFTIESGTYTFSIRPIMYTKIINGTCLMKYSQPQVNFKFDQKTAGNKAENIKLYNGDNAPTGLNCSAPSYASTESYVYSNTYNNLTSDITYELGWTD